MAESDVNQTQALLTSAPIQLEEKLPADNAVSSVQPFASVAQLPVYPTKAYPHSYLACSVIVAVLCGICNLSSITCTIPAMVLSVLVSHKYIVFVVYMIICVLVAMRKQYNVTVYGRTCKLRQLLRDVVYIICMCMCFNKDIYPYSRKIWWWFGGLACDHQIKICRYFILASIRMAIPC